MYPYSFIVVFLLVEARARRFWIEAHGTCVEPVPIDRFYEEPDDIWRTVSWVYSSILKNFAVLGSVLGGSILAMLETDDFAHGKEAG